MIQEDKDLLLRDLCTRLPYGVKISLNTDEIQNIGVLDALYPNDECIIVDHLEKRFPLKNGYGTVDYGRFSLEESNFKPYLRPMDSMTEEEKEEMYNLLSPEGTAMYRNEGIAIPINHCGSFVPYEFMSRIIDYLNAHHFDYRGLIPMGLALNRKEYNIFKNE